MTKSSSGRTTVLPDVTIEVLCDEYRHLVCKPYSIKNLHEAAAQLGIKRCWFHSGKYPHYDIPKRRISEIMGKCTVIPTKEVYRIITDDSVDTA